MRQTIDYLIWKYVILHLRKKTQDSIFSVDGNYGVQDTTGKNKKLLNVQNGKGQTTEKKTTDLYLASLPINWTMHLSVITGMGGKKQVTFTDWEKWDSITKPVFFYCINCIYHEKGVWQL